jgi:aldose 1-epimerase
MTTNHDTITLTNSTNKISSSTVTCVVDANHGARLSSLVVNNHELLVQANAETKLSDPMSWGAYPMAPWAGRVRDGAFAHDGTAHQLRLNKAPHAIHGTVFDKSWAITSATSSSATLTTDLGEHWPLGGSVEHRVSLSDNVLECQLTVTAGARSMPVQVGWHPWFVRPVMLTCAFGKMLVRDDHGIPSGETISPTPPPWDDCFTSARTSPFLNFGNGTAITIESDCEYWVIYDEPDHAVCVEPQSGAPDGFNLEAQVIQPGQSLSRWMRLVIS